jgi:hypothetical protein
VPTSTDDSSAFSAANGGSGLADQRTCVRAVEKAREKRERTVKI